MTFLRRVWATLATLPVIAGALIAGVTEVSGVLAHQLPAGPAGAVTHVAIALVAVIGFGALVVTQVERVEPEFRGFPTAPLSKKAQVLKDAADALAQVKADGAQMKADYETRIAALEAQLPAAPTAEPVVPPAA